MQPPKRERSLNPIIVKGARSRLRKGSLISWGVVVLTITGFVSSIVYLVQTEQGLATPETAAKMTLLPIIIIQAVLLMLFGTGAVASGISQERDHGLLDYQRMTPMSPTSKLIGYLFGLPIREYALFALTLPFMAFGIIKGGFPLATVAQFYLIFFSSVLVYHMTGLAAGMLSAKPRRAGLIAQGMVLLLYFALPLLSFVGMTFFEFLTIRPALFGMIYQEIQNAGGSPEAIAGITGFTSLDSFRAIPFFNIHLHPIVYTLLVQGGLIITLWAAVHRKWRDEALHEFSKWFGLVFFAGASTFLLGSVWPILSNQEVYVQLLRQFFDNPGSPLPNEELLSQFEANILTTVLLMISLIMLTAIGFITLLSTTPSTDKTKQGWRRVARLGGNRIPLNWDAASSLPLILACTGIGAAIYAIIVYLTLDNNRFHDAPSLLSLVFPALYLGMTLLFLQATLERFGKRAFFVSVFLLWMVPFFSAILVGAAFEHQVLSGYVSLPFPPTALFYMSINSLNVGTTGEYLFENGPSDLVSNVHAMSIWAIVGYSILAIGMLAVAQRFRRRLRNDTLAGELS